MTNLVGEEAHRRRRTWYRRRLRIQKTLAATSIFLLLAAASWQNFARHFALWTFHPSQILPDSFWGKGDIHRNLASVATRSSTATAWRARRSYPYSVIPGGVRDIHELREVAARDYVVRRHYSRFNYNRARLIRAGEGRLVYMSYRIGDAVFWTRKKVHLHPDELLLTDGAITGRARCGNQISEEPKSETSPEEPSEEALDQPVALEPDARGLPFRSALRRRWLPWVDPLPPSPEKVFAGGFGFPYVPFGGGGVSGGGGGTCETAGQEHWENTHGIVDDERHEKLCSPRHKPPVPEPATILLISSGFAGIYWRYRRNTSRRAAVSVDRRP